MSESSVAVYPFPYVGDWTEEERKEARATRLRELTEKWEAILRDSPDPACRCSHCGQPVPKRGKRGPRRLYCSTRCRMRAARARRGSHGQPDWLPAVPVKSLARYATEDAVNYADAFPGDHPPLNAPVLPRDQDLRNGWASEVVGQFD